MQKDGTGDTTLKSCEDERHCLEGRGGERCKMRKPNRRKGKKEGFTDRSRQRDARLARLDFLLVALVATLGTEAPSTFSTMRFGSDHRDELCFT